MTANVRHLEQPDLAAVDVDLFKPFLEPLLLLSLVSVPLLDRLTLGQVLAALVDVQAVSVEVDVELRGEERRGNRAPFVALAV